MRNVFTLSAAFIIGLSTFPASANADGVPAFMLQPRNTTGIVTYRFTVSSTPGPPIEPQTIRFTTYDPDHVRMTLLDASGAETSETIVGELDAEERLQPRLKRDSHWALPVALYNDLVVLANAASAPRYPGKPMTAKVAPIAGADDIDGTITTTPGKESRLVFDGAGSSAPSHDPAGASAGGDGGGQPGGMGHGRRGGRHGSGRQDEPRKADATVHVDAVFLNSVLEHAEGSESLTVAAAGADPASSTQQSWSVVIVP